MEHRVSNTWRMTVNEKKFIETALENDIRVDGRRPFDYRPLTIKLGREDGSSEVHLGQTHVMGYVTSQLVQPYRDRPNEGTLSIYTEFSPMADPAFELGRPGESAIELGRVIDRGLRESKAIDMESLSIVAGKYVWAIRVDIHILDNGGNLIDAANIAALAALMTFRRPECTVVGEHGQEVTVHPPETREPLPLVIHHLPVAVTFAFFNEGNTMVVDPTYNEEAVMGGRMTSTITLNGEVCAVQKAGGEGVLSSVIMQCLRIASMKAADITKEIKSVVESYDNEGTLRKVKHHSSMAVLEVNIRDLDMKDRGEEISVHHVAALKDDADKIHRVEPTSSHRSSVGCSSQNVKPLIGGASVWDPYSKGISPDLVRHVPASPSLSTACNEEAVETVSVKKLDEFQMEESSFNQDGVMTVEASETTQKTHIPKSLKDAVKPKHRRRKKQQHSSKDDK